MNVLRIQIYSAPDRLTERCISFCKMTTTRYGQHPQQPHTSTTATTTVVTHSFHHIPRTTWIVQAIPSSSISTNSRTRKRRRSRKSQNSSSNQGTKHDNKNNNEDDGSILSTSKYKTHFKYILIVILLSFTFADMVYGKFKSDL